MSDMPAIPGYENFSKVAEGGMGVIYRAEQIKPKRRVAIKFLPANKVSPISLARFRHETQLAAQLEHPHIVPIYDYGEIDGTPYLVSRFLGGGSLADRLAESGSLFPGELIKWMEEVASALDHVHKRGIVHHDVKPSNILLDRAGSAYLTDFGITGDFEGVAPAYVTSGENIPPGSAPYMSPEQAKGELTSPASDVYGLAATAFELMTGEYPYNAKTPLGIIMRHIHDPIPDPSEIKPNIPPSIVNIVQWGLAKLPADRPATPTEFVKMFRQAVEKPNALINPDIQSPLAPSKRSVQLFRGLFLLGAFGTLAIFAFVRQNLQNNDAAEIAATETSPPITLALPPTSEPSPPTPVGLLLFDDFNEDTGGIAARDGADGSISYTNNGLLMISKEPNAEWYAPAGKLDVQDVHLITNGAMAADKGVGEAGLICRWQDAGNFTAFAVNLVENQYTIWQIRQGEFTPLQPWRAIEGADLSGAERSIKLEAICDQSQLQLKINGALQPPVSDPNPHSGDVGLLVGLFEGEQFGALFYQLTARQP